MNEILREFGFPGALLVSLIAGAIKVARWIAPYIQDLFSTVRDFIKAIERLATQNAESIQGIHDGVQEHSKVVTGVYNGIQGMQNGIQEQSKAIEGMHVGVQELVDEFRKLNTQANETAVIVSPVVVIHRANQLGIAPIDASAVAHQLLSNLDVCRQFSGAQSHFSSPG